MTAAIRPSQGQLFFFFFSPKNSNHHSCLSLCVLSCLCVKKEVVYFLGSSCELSAAVGDGVSMSADTAELSVL